MKATAELVTAAAAGGERAGGVLVVRFAPLVHSVIDSYGLKRADALAQQLALEVDLRDAHERRCHDSEVRARAPVPRV